MSYQRLKDVSIINRTKKGSSENHSGLPWKIEVHVIPTLLQPIG